MNLNLPSSPTKLLSSDADLPTDLTTETILSLLVETVQCFIEQIWYYRSVYPPESFETRRAFELEVHSSAHPGVRQYLKEVALEVLGLMKRGVLKRLFVEVYEGDSKVESYGLSFTDSILFEYLKQRCPVEFGNAFKEGVLYASLQALLYSVISELSGLERLENYSAFKILVSTDGSEFGQMVRSDGWVLEAADVGGADVSGTNLEDVNVSQFKEVNLGYLSVKGYCMRRSGR